MAICDGADADVSMVHESTIGVLAYTSASPICATAPVAGHQGHRVGPEGPGRAARPRWWSRRSGRSPFRRLMANSGTGGTATTFKSKFSKKPVTTVR